MHMAIRGVKARGEEEEEFIANSKPAKSGDRRSGKQKELT